MGKNHATVFRLPRNAMSVLSAFTHFYVDSYLKSIFLTFKLKSFILYNLRFTPHTYIQFQPRRILHLSFTVNNGG